MRRQRLVPLTQSRETHELSQLFLQSQQGPKNIGIIEKPLLMTLLDLIDFQTTLCITINRETVNALREFIYYLLLGQQTDLNLLDSIIQVIAAKLTGAHISDNYRVGIEAAEAIMGPLTQDTLNTFHTAGAKSTVGGLMGVQSIISDVNTGQQYISAAPAFRYSSVEEVLLRLSKKISGTNISEFIVSHTLGAIPEGTSYDQMIHLLSTTTDGQIYRSQNSFTRHLRENFGTLGSKIPRRYVRFFLNPELLYIYQLLPTEFAQKINQITHTIHSVRYSNIFVAVPGTITNPFIDVYPNSAVIMKMLHMMDDRKQTAADLFFISTTLQNLLRSTYMGGIPNIRINNVHSIKVYSIIWRELFYFNEHYFLISLGLVRKMGIYLDDLIELMDYLDIEYHSITPQESPVYPFPSGDDEQNNNYLALIVRLTKQQAWSKLVDQANSIISSVKEAFVLKDNQQSLDILQQILNILQQIINLVQTGPIDIDNQLSGLLAQFNQANERVKQNNSKWSQKAIKTADVKLTPYKYITYVIGKAVDQRDRELKEQKDLSLSTWTPVDPVIDLSQRFRLDIHGSNILRLLMSGYVSQDMVNTSSLTNTMYIYGIEAARQRIIASIVANMESRNSYIDWKHIALIADRMTYSGSVHGLTYNGQSKDPNANPFSVFTTERANTLIPSNCLFGVTDQTSNTTTGIIAGVIIPGLQAPPEATAYANQVLGITGGERLQHMDGDERVPYSEHEAAEEAEPEDQNPEVPITLADLGIGNYAVAQPGQYQQVLPVQTTVPEQPRVVSPIRIGQTMLAEFRPVVRPVRTYQPTYTDSSLPNLISPGEMMQNYEKDPALDSYLQGLFDGPYQILTIYSNFSN